MAMWATQQPRRGDTTSCASRPSAGIDRAKCLISLKATGEQRTFFRKLPRRARAPGQPGGGGADAKAFRSRGPPRAIFPCDFLLEMLKMLDRCERRTWRWLGGVHCCVTKVPEPVTKNVTKKRGRPPLGERAMTAAERQRRCRRERW